MGKAQGTAAVVGVFWAVLLEPQAAQLGRGGGGFDVVKTPRFGGLQGLELPWAGEPRKRTGKTLQRSGTLSLAQRRGRNAQGTEEECGRIEI